MHEKNLIRSVALCLLTFLMAISFGTSAQSKYRNGVFLELGGPGSLYSVNYEKQFSKGWVGRIGFSTYHSDNSVQYFPLTLGKVFGQEKHHVELAGGIDYIIYEAISKATGEKLGREQTIGAILFVGYRYQKPDKRFFCRAGFTPYASPGLLQLWGGLSGGYRF